VLFGAALARHLLAFRRARGGNVALIAAIALPTLLGTGALALDFARAWSVREGLQAAADAAALAAAAELPLRSTSESTVDAIVSEYVTRNLNPNVQLASTESNILPQRAGVQVELRAQIPSVMGGLINPEGFAPRAMSVARLASGAPLCALALEERQQRAIFLNQRARIIAPDCAVMSNSTSPRGVVALDGTELRATTICSAGGYNGSRGNFYPDPVTDCPAIPDPLAARQEPASGGCNSLLTLQITGRRNLSPGVYCGGITVLPGATVNLSAGVYVMKNGPLNVMNGASLIGTNVGFYFVGDLSTMNLTANSRIELTAPRDGPMAGFLFFANRVLLTGDLNLRHFRISSNNARTLLGTIYLRDGVLDVDAQRPIADRSAYTVIVARRIQVTAGPDLVLNTDYDGTDVPVPDGVGPRRPQAFLAE
jgi:hypothetical protein